MITTDVLREILKQTRARKLLDAPGWEPVLEQWAGGLNRFVKEYGLRFPDNPADPIKFFHSAPTKAAAFFELDTLRSSTEMKIAVWLILQGWEIDRVEVDVRRRQSSMVRLVLRAPYGDEETTYESDDPEDIRLIRHFGTITINNQPEFQGYHAFAMSS